MTIAMKTTTKTMLLLAFCLNVPRYASAAASFVVTETSVAPTSSAVSADLKFLKELSVSADAASELSSISALVLDLPGQVFVSCAATATLPSTSSSSPLLGEIKVYTGTEALAASVSAASKSAMRGSKLVVSSRIGNSTDLMLTEIVLRRKNALKKLITNGVGDVVVLNDALFTKSKTDVLRYPALTHSSSTVSPVLQALPDRANRSTWMLVDPGNGSTTSLSLSLAGGGSVLLRRIDSDLLPEGAVGTVFSYSKEALVSGLVAGSATAQTLSVRTMDPSVRVRVNLAPSVEVTGIAQNLSATSQVTTSDDLNATISDDAVTVLVNGSGNLIVSARNSSVYADAASFLALGDGFLQAWFKSISATAGVAVVNRDQDELHPIRSEVVFGLVATPTIVCLGSNAGNTVGVFSRDLDWNTSTCRTYDEPVRTGRAGSLVEQTAPPASRSPDTSTSSAPTRAFVTAAALSAAAMISAVLLL